MHLAQEEVLNKFLLEKTINVRPLAVDLLPTLRVIAKSEESRCVILFSLNLVELIIDVTKSSNAHLFPLFTNGP